MTFILSHLHWPLFAALAFVLMYVKSFKLKAVLTVFILALLTFNSTGIYRYVPPTPMERSTVKMIRADKGVTDTQLKPVLDREEREARTEKLFDFQQKYDDVLGDGDAKVSK